MKVMRSMCYGLAFLLLGMPLATRAAVVYVDADATGANDGSSWSNAYTSVATALTTGTGEFWIAEGTYYTPTSAGTEIGANEIYGGFQGTETSRDQRNWTSYPTILDGGSSNRVLQKTVAGIAILDGFTVQNGTNSASGGGIYCTAGSLTIGNCIFTNNVSSGSGGAIYHAVAGVSNTFSNCTFVVNRASGGAGLAGGAICFNNLSTNVFQGCTFVANTASGFDYGGNTGLGGAIGEKAAGGLLRLSGCVFSNNVSTNGGSWSAGGAIYSQGTLDLSGGNNIFGGNWADGSGGAIYHTRTGASNAFVNCTFTGNAGYEAEGMAGGAICFNNLSTNVFQGCTFVANNAIGESYSGNNGNGGAIGEKTAGGLLWLSGCVFSNNSCTNIRSTAVGGAIYSQGTLDLSAGCNRFDGNWAKSSGGAIYHVANVTGNIVSNCTFTANIAGSGNSGGAMYFNSACTALVGNCAFIANAPAGGNGSGGGIYFAGAGLYSLINCTFFTNRATGTGQGGAVRTASASAILNVTNCIFWGNATAGGTGTNIQNAGTVTIAYSDVATNANAVNGGTKNFESGIINVDPLFASEVQPYDVHLKSTAGRWNPGTSAWVQDTVDSPCIDAGDPASDYSLEPFDNGLRIDMGRYGNTTEASKTTLGPDAGPILRLK